MTRIPVMSVEPQIEGGLYPAKAVPGEPFPVRARIFGEDGVIARAEVILCDPDGIDRAPFPMRERENDWWHAAVTADAVGAWTYRIATWHDPIAEWLRDAPETLSARDDADVMLAKGATLLRRASGHDRERLAVADVLDDPSGSRQARLVVAQQFMQSLGSQALREHLDESDELPVYVDRERALVGAWYAMTAPTLRTAAERLKHVALMGFDVVALPPIDPQLEAIGEFNDFVLQAAHLGLDVALDLVLDGSPDHPWVTEHPEWFARRPDTSGSMRLIVDNDPTGIQTEVLRTVRFWIRQGVQIFRVVDPGSKPLAFWETLLSDIRDSHPDVVFLADAVSTPAMQDGLAKVGFHQSITSFTSRQNAAEVTDFITQITRHTSDFLRPNLFVTSPGSVPSYLQTGDEAMFKVRAVLAATASPTWGMHAGYELLDADATSSTTRNPDDAPLAAYVTRINEARRAHPALHRLRNLTLHPTSEPGVIAFSKIAADDVVLVVIDLFPSFRKSVAIKVDPYRLGLRDGYTLRLLDELDGHVCTLDDIPVPPETPARILTPFLRR